MAKSKSFFRRLLSGTVYAVGLTAAAVICFLLVLLLTGQFEGLSQPDAVGTDPLNPGQTTDAHALADIFGQEIPVLPGYPMHGQALNTSYNGRNVRMAILQYDGFTVTCVQPAFAAPLLVKNQLSLSLKEGFAVDGLPAVMAEKDGAYCLYFNTDHAAYSLFAPAADEDSFLQLAQKIKLIK